MIETEKLSYMSESEALLFENEIPAVKKNSMARMNELFEYRYLNEDWMDLREVNSRWSKKGYVNGEKWKELEYVYNFLFLKKVQKVVEKDLKMATTRSMAEKEASEDKRLLEKQQEEMMKLKEDQEKLLKEIEKKQERT